MYINNKLLNIYLTEEDNKNLLKLILNKNVFNFMVTGVELQKKKFKYTNLLDASVALSTLSNFDDNNIITSSKRKILLFNLNNKKISKTYVIQESGNIIGVVKKDK
jgi:tellurite resistance protein